jgi:hypothetical protein
MVQKVPGGLSVSKYRCNGVRHFIGHRGREPPHRCDVINVRQIHLRCESAWGPGADRHAKLLIHTAVEGALLDAYSQSTRFCKRTHG